jgi:hypothetical protein
MRATKKHLAGIVAATTVGAFALYQFRNRGGEDDPEADTDAAAPA